MSRDRCACLALMLTALLFLGTPALAQTATDRNDDGSPRLLSNPGVPRSGTSATPSGNTGSLTTLFAQNNQFAGNTFDLVPKVRLMITGFDVNLSTGDLTTITIYWRDGTALGNESNPAGWTRLGSATVIPNGPNIPTPVAIGDLTLDAGKTYGFYVDTESYPSASLMYTNGGPTSFSNDDLTLTTYYGKGNPAFTGSSFFPRQWNGTVYYTVIVEVPTLSEVAQGALVLLLAASAVWALRRARYVGPWPQH